MRFDRALCVGFSLLTATSLAAATKKAAPPKPKPSTPNQVKGQQQIAGANGQFGTVYSLKNGFNFAILSARYTLEPFIAYETVKAETEKKIFVFDFAVKNADPEDKFFSSDSLFTLVDDKGQLYASGALALQSKGKNEGSFTLRPGQGLGQPELKDPLQYAVLLPEKARIVKIMVNQGRKGRNEETLRYFIAGATQAEAGEKGDPKNVVAPLPTEARDPADSTGSTPLAEGKGTMGTYAPSGYFDLRLDSFSYSTDSLVDNAGPEEGNKFAVATVTVKSLVPITLSMFDVSGGDDPLYQITDSDDEREKPVTFLKAKRNESAEHEFKQGDEYSFRIVFSLPKDATAKTLVLGTGGARKWAIDVSGSK